MEKESISYLISSILFLVAATIFIGFNALGDKTADFISGGLFGLAGLVCFYLYFQKRKNNE